MRQTARVVLARSSAAEALRCPSPDAGRLARGAESRIAALCMAGLLVLGALLGSINLLVDGVLRDGAPRQLYAGTMGLLLVLGLVLGIRRRAGVGETFALVLTGDLVYVVVARSIADPLRYATPLMLLFAVITAAWFLDRWMLAVHLVVVPLACWIALAPSSQHAPALAVQVVVDAVVLDVVALGVYVLRRRTQRLLIATQRLSSTDPLTGLANRRSLEVGADRIWRLATRGDLRVAALVIDLDRFKALNDDHGHAVGDAVLQSVAAALAGVVRPTDVLARTGGEELVVLGLVDGAHEAQQLGERLRGAVREARPEGPRVTASIGVALTLPDSADPGREVWRLIDRADAAMYEAKQAGRDRVELSVAAGEPLPRTPGQPATSDVG